MNLDPEASTTMNLPRYKRGRGAIFHCQRKLWPGHVQYYTVTALLPPVGGGGGGGACYIKFPSKVTKT